MFSIFGGKFTTYRLMAEKLCDLVCAKLGVNAECRTAIEPLIADPSPAMLNKAAKYFPVHSVPLVANRLGDAFPIVVEKAAAMKSNPLLCECEMVTRAEIEYVASDPSSQSIIKHLLKRYNEEHRATVIISSHNLNHTVDICPRIALLEHGVIIRDLQNEGNSAERELEAYFNLAVEEEIREEQEEDKAQQPEEEAQP